MRPVSVVYRSSHILFCEFSVIRQQSESEQTKREWVVDEGGGGVYREGDLCQILRDI